MSISRLAKAAGLFVLVAAPLAAIADTYTIADFTGGISPGNANVQAPFSGNGFSQSDPLSGHFVLDNQLVPSGGSGWLNVFYNQFPDIGSIPNADAFSLTLDGLSVNLGDNIDSLIPAGIQYLDGAFRGFVFNSDFEFQNAWYQFSITGSVFTVYQLDGIANFYDPHGYPTGGQLIGGYINGSLSNANGYVVPVVVTPPEVPEPATLALLGLSLVGLGFARRRRAT